MKENIQNEKGSATIEFLGMVPLDYVDFILPKGQPTMKHSFTNNDESSFS